MSVSEILNSRKENHYYQDLINIDLNNSELFIISDLHMAAGLNVNGNFDGTENFFADDSFERFLEHLQTRVSAKDPATLVINGDFVDFLRIRNIPLSTEDFTRWKAVLDDLGMGISLESLRASVSPKEIQYGLKTNDYKSVWKLDVCSRGHEPVFKGLAKWLINGNRLIIVKGNHDLEWYWEPVRNYLRLILAHHLSLINSFAKENNLAGIVLPNVTFIDDKVIVGNKIYIEHGHRYEHFTTVDGPPVLKASPKELNLPFGSFFNRYLVNRLELAFPNIDDIRPRPNILPLLFRERFPLALKMLFRYVPFMLLIIPKQQYRFALRYLFQFLLFVIVPLGITAIAFYINYPGLVRDIESVGTPNHTWGELLSPLKNLLPLTLTYFSGKLFAALQLSAPPSFYPNALAVFNVYPELEWVTFGHTHDPEQKVLPGKTYYNTGTWIPVYEIDAADVRLDKTYTFLHFFKGETRKIQCPGLQRWNDDASRVDLLQLRDQI